MQTEGLAGRRAVITGAGRGLGAALAIALAEAGSSVVLCGRNPAGLSDTAAIIRERTSSEPHRVALDLADAANVEAAGRKLADSEDSRGSNRDVVEAVIFALTRPRHLTLAITLDADDGGQFPKMPCG